MAIDLNADMGEIIKGLLSKKDSAAGSGAVGGGSSDIIAKIMPYKNALIILFMAIIGVVAYVQFYYSPMSAENSKKLDEINKLIGMKEETKKLEQRIVQLKKKLSKSREHYVESLSHFGNSEDLGALYQSVSTLASKYDLVVLNIKEIPPPPPKPEKPKPLSTKKGKKGAKAKAPPKPKNQTKVKEIKVDVELKGRYAEYVRFKEDLAIAEMLLKINTENIKVKTDKKEQGKVFVSLNLSTYAIDKKPFQKVMKENEDS